MSFEAKCMKRSRQNLLWILPLVLLFATFVPLRFTFGDENLDDVVDALGFGLVLIGVGLRVCARGWKYEQGQQGLVTDGLYGYVRHPLYAASFLIGLGICVMIGVPAFALAFVLFFWASHLPVMRREEEKLARRWPEIYTEYRSRVPALVPAIGRLRDRAAIRPRALAQSIRREADSVCGWSLASAALHAWQDTVVPVSRHVDTPEVRVLIGVSLLLGIAWALLRSGWLPGLRTTSGPAI
jgi:protein-S-isoprenylcysteine O-methyltransferase Ste14